MMEEILRAYLAADTTLAGLVGDRISWGQRNRGDGLPAIVLHVISAPRAYTTKGRVALVGRLVQVDAWAASFASAKAISRAVVAAIDLLGDPTADLQAGFIENERDDNEAIDGPDGAASDTVFRTSLDVRVWSNDT